MNEWVNKSIEIANSKGYLDRLHEVYPVTIESERKLNNNIKRQLKITYEKRDCTKLFRMLLKFKKFPIKDPYVAFLRKKDVFIDYNPRTVERITNRLYDIGFDEMIEGIEEPKEFNRQIGTLFKAWIPKIGYPLLSRLDFEKYEGIAFLQGSDNELKDYANNYLGCELSKAPDLIAKKYENYVIGEAKFLTETGGHQNAQFEDAMRLIKSPIENAIPIAVLDGVVWVQGKTKIFKAVCNLKEIALTSLLLKEFIEQLNSNNQ